MELQERLKAVRRYSKLTQADFGKALGCSRDTIANYEGGRAVPTDTFLQLICAKFPISESWLLTGAGSMVLDSEASLFSTFAKQFDLSLAEQNLAKFVLTLPTEERRQLLKNLLQMADAIRGLPPRDIDIDKEVDDYRMELEAQKAGQGKLPPSGTTAAPIQKKNA